MQLLFDIGNTRIKWVYWHANAFHQMGSIAYRGQTIEWIINQLPRQNATKIWVSNVGGREVEVALTGWAIQQQNQMPYFIQSQANYGRLQNGYLQPNRLGVDRWMALIGAWERLRQAVCVVDLGTAVTIDVIDHDGKHRGGYIFPGFQTQWRSLTQNTALLRGDTPPAPRELMPQVDTIPAMQHGVWLNIASAVTSAWQLAQKQLAEQLNYQFLPLILTGGDAVYVSSCLTPAHTIAPDLVLEGVAAWSKNG